MSNQQWSDSRIRERVRLRQRHYEQQGATLISAIALAWPDVCVEMRDEYEESLAALKAENASRCDAVEWSREAYRFVAAMAKQGFSTAIFLEESAPDGVKEQPEDEEEVTK